MSIHEDTLADYGIMQEDIFVRSKRVGKHTMLPSGFELRLLEYVQREIQSRLHYDVIGSLNGRIEIRTTEKYDVIVELITTIHCKYISTGIVMY